ncbi:MAG TPA: glycosyltransferase 61 family protein [Stellaceae bacterium]|nr:glycosyltransferase 61 family protein [Stellaceae bacterium]
MESLLEPANFLVPNAVAYTNLTTHDEGFASHMLRDIYTSRDCTLAGVSLVALPSGATVLGGGHFVLRIGNYLIAEQYPDYFRKTPGHVAATLVSKRPTEDIKHEALLIARFGVFVWGHWLCELLPKLVLVESAYPGRFSFVIPEEVFSTPDAALPFARMRESLAAYGIDRGRVTAVRHDRDYRFSRMFAVTPVWSDHMMHPGASAAMRTGLRERAESPSFRRLAIRRIPGWGRELQNFTELERMLCANGFGLRMMGVYPFLEQAAAFREAEIVFGVLGSDLANLLYAPEGIRVISAAPAVFGDRFFYALVLGRRGRMIDLRGTVTAVDKETAHRSAFRIEPGELSKSIAMLMNQGTV